MNEDAQRSVSMCTFVPVMCNFVPVKQVNSVPAAAGGRDTQRHRARQTVLLYQ
jgi:hypothetical protein